MNPTILFVTLLASHAGPQTASQSTPPKPAAASADVDSIDHIVAALYDVISGPIGQKRNWERFRSLFPADAKMGAVIQTRTGAIREVDFSLDRYVTSSGPVMERDGFFERELSRKTEEFGHIAHVFSTYESRYHPNDKPFERGINSLQLFNDGKRWWVRTILWEGESATLKLPRKYTR